MDDAVRPTKAAFDRIFCESYRLWSLYLNAADITSSLAFDCIDLKKLLKQTPSYLGWGLRFQKPEISFSCVEKESGPGQYGLLTSGRSIWRTSNGECPLPPRDIPLNLLLGVQNPMLIHVSDCSPLTEWPGIRGIEDHDEGNYLAVLLLARAGSELGHVPPTRYQINHAILRLT